METVTIMGDVVTIDCLSMGLSRPFSFALLSLGLVSGLYSCSQPQAEQAGTGTLTVYANGEDFVSQGFTTKDGWQISFDRVYVTLAQVVAYQTEPAFQPQPGEFPKAKTQAGLDQAITVDLADGPVQVGAVTAPAGRYNALSWQMVAAPEGEAQGFPLMMVGTATKAAATIEFSLQIEEELGFVCGDFIGDERKGFVKADSGAEVEATFHFDHLFGDANADGEINDGALGFEPLAALAKNGQIEADSKTLAATLSPEQSQQLQSILRDLGHVGEGHCQANG